MVHPAQLKANEGPLLTAARPISVASPQRPDLAFLIPSLRGGGAERVIVDLASEAANRGLRVDIVVVNRENAAIDDVGAGVRIIDLNRTRVAFALPVFMRYLRRARPPAILSTLGHTNVLALVGARLTRGSRIVVREAVTVEKDLAGGGYMMRVVYGLMRLTYPWADAIVAVSEGVAQSLIAELGLAPAKVRVIFNPAITPRVLEGAKEALDHPWFRPNEPPVVLGVGRLDAQKGFDTLLRSFAEARRLEPCRLLLLGEGPLRGELQSLAHELGIFEDFEMPGFVRNPFAYMARCGVFVLSSRWEGLPNVLIQALAVGAKAVATDCPNGPREVTDKGRLAPLVPVDDVAGLADAIVVALRSQPVKPGAEWFQRYALEHVTSRYLALLKVSDLDQRD